MKAMACRDHEIVWPTAADGNGEGRRLANCDVVHVFRRSDREAQQMLTRLLRGGTGITYDNDDDLTAVPKESADYKRIGGLHGQRVFAGSAKVARLARVCTTTNELLAEQYRRAGVERVEVIANHLAPDAVRPTTRHDGLVIGWIAGNEHRADVSRLPIREALERILAKHDHVRAECIGVDLGLSQRYRHDKSVEFEALPERIGGFDIGIAPLADIPMNRARSDIKVKEYAASAVPWLASPFGPYLGLGEAEGGRLVADDDWFEALDRLVTRQRERRRLARKGKSWAKGHTIDAVADRWEQLFIEAAS
jgi:glycosyltransferase involved in cell wall biosynthesis